MIIQDIIVNSKLPRLETEMLLAFTLKKEREFIITHPEYEISAQETKKINSLEKRRLNNWPIAYLTGEKEFYGLNFKVSKATLVPRPETETLIDIILQESVSRKNKKNGLTFIDIGTGSGAIIISLAKNIFQLLPTLYEKSRFYASDISASALKIAAQNRKNLKLEKKVAFRHGNLLSVFKKSELKDRDLIISANLPYLTPKQTYSEPSISREPALALVAGKDGLKYYRKLLKELKNIKCSSLSLICEIDPAQSEEIKNIMRSNFSDSRPIIKKDLRKKNRFAILKIKNSA